MKGPEHINDFMRCHKALSSYINSSLYSSPDIPLHLDSTVALFHFSHTFLLHVSPVLGPHLCQHTALSLGFDRVLSRDLAQLLLLVQQPVGLIHRELFVQASQRRHCHCSAALCAVGGSAVLSQSLEGHHGVLWSRGVKCVTKTVGMGG